MAYSFSSHPCHMIGWLFLSFASVTQVAASVNLLGKPPCGHRFVHPNHWPCLKQPADAVFYNRAIFFSAPTYTDCNSEGFKYTQVRYIVAYIEASAAGNYQFFSSFLLLLLVHTFCPALRICLCYTLEDGYLFVYFGSVLLPLNNSCSTLSQLCNGQVRLDFYINSCGFPLQVHMVCPDQPLEF